MSLDEARRQLQRARGRHYWRSLEELSASDAFQKMVAQEFPRQAAVAEWDPVDRRDFLRLMGASLALAGLTACTKQPPERIVPYVTPPEDFIPGKPMFFATAMTLGGYAYGLVMESHQGRPTKAEGNADHPGSLGGTDVFGQASVLGLYDPDRSQVFLQRGRPSTWSTFVAEMGDAMTLQGTSQGDNLRILTETTTSPTVAWMMEDLLARYPKAKWHQYDPVNRDHAREGARLAFGEFVDTQYRLDRAEVVLSLDADFMAWDPGHLRYARDFMAGRKVADSGAEMNRLYVVESTTSTTGTVADHRLAVKPSQVEAIARALAAQVGLAGVTAPDVGEHAAWVEAAARDLTQHRGACVVVVGDQQPPAVHALAHHLNQALEAVGRTLVYTEPVEARAAAQTAGLQELVKDLNDRKVDMLVILGGNPVYNAPADLRFGAAMENARLRVHLSLYEDETSALCQWHVPEAHFLEAWGDARAFDGTASIIQPLIQPLYQGKSVIDLLNVLGGKASKNGYDTVREYWQSRNIAADFEAFWRKSLHDGVVPGTAMSAKAVSLAGSVPEPTAPTGAKFEVLYLPDPAIYDGRFANNGWLQEVPRPLTKLVWDNALMISPATAGYYRIRHGDMIEVFTRGVKLNLPACITPGHADECGTVHLGYGRARAGRTGNGVGANAYAARQAQAPWIVEGEVFNLGYQHELVGTQDHSSMEGRGHYRAATLEEFKHDPGFANGPHYEEFGVEPPVIYKSDVDLTQGDQWGMVIDLGACIGCNACVVACQAENNIPVVGKDQVRRNREMHWIRIDRYYEGDAAHARASFQPVNCMHCENAPCEAVCPVAATVHSPDGLNQMVYNRCVGTRYCSNNCPYKVRRFNFYKFADHDTPSLKLMRNPDVTVRARGVMEKCTYCVQRISGARIAAKKEGRAIREGEVVAACQQACPTQAIAFGNLNDPDSRVARLKASPLNFGVLRVLNTRPRTTYLARITNPNPALEGGAEGAPHGGHAGAHGES